MKPSLLALVAALLMTLALAGCASTSQDRGPFHEYLHEHGLE